VKLAILWSAYQNDLEIMIVTYPLLTPSTCKSTHHTPGMLSINHSVVYLTVWPSGAHSKTKKYNAQKNSKNGTLMKKRNKDTGIQRKLAGAGGTGRKGAMAVPIACCQPHLARAKHCQ
jgi:hypothetical protein